MKEITKKVWKIKYKGDDANMAEKEVITDSYEKLAVWLDRRRWVNTITSIVLDREITELVL